MFPFDCLTAWMMVRPKMPSFANRPRNTTVQCNAAFPSHIVSEISVSSGEWNAWLDPVHNCYWLIHLVVVWITGSSTWSAEQHQLISLLICVRTFVLRRIYTTSEISVRASESNLGRNQDKWIDVLRLHWSESMSETFALDVRVWDRRYT